MSSQSQYLLVGGMMVLAGSVSGCYVEEEAGDAEVEALLEEGDSDVPLEPSSGSACSWYLAPQSLGQCAGCSICLDRTPAIWSCVSWAQPNGKTRWDVHAYYTNGEHYSTGCK